MDNVEYFLELEEEAEQLSLAIKSLYREIDSYKNAKNDFVISRDFLTSLIQKTDLLLDNSHSVISRMKDIGMPQLLSKTDELETLMTNIKFELNNLIQEYHIDLSNHLIGLDKRNKFNTILISITIVVSLVNLILLIIR